MRIWEQLCVGASGLFDADWYAAEYLGGRRWGVDPAWHYVNEGWRRGFEPGPCFSTSRYQALRPAARMADVSPLYHFLRHPGIAPEDVVPYERNPSFAREPKISVVVASYNYARYLGAALDSVLGQTYRNLEVVVVDDGSVDESRDVVAAYARKDPRVRLFRHPDGANRGLPATLKLGVEKASGEYVAFCESDDLLMPDNLAEKVRVLNAHPDAAIVVNDLVPFGDCDRWEGVARAVAEGMAGLPDAENLVPPMKFRERNWIPTFSCCLVRRDLLAACDFTGSPRPENLDWWLWRQVCCGRPLHVVRGRLTRWRLHASYMAGRRLDSILKQDEFLDRMDELLVRRSPEAAADIRAWRAARERFAFREGMFRESDAPVAGQPLFTVVMPTFNRAHCIRTAVDSVLAQTYRNFELVVADDGSTDGTADLLSETYAQEIASGRLRIVPGPNGGPSAARNRALAVARGDWIAYMDTDNEMRPDFLRAFAREILADPARACFNARLVFRSACRTVGRPFDRERLLRDNYIDLGVYVHRKELLAESGPFDERMTRLVDWDFVVRQTRKHEPGFVNEIVLVYDDSRSASRITNDVRLGENLSYFRRKHGIPDPGGETVAHGAGWAAVLPYGLVVTARRMLTGVQEDRPLFAYPSTAKTLRRIVKFLAPYGLVNARKDG